MAQEDIGRKVELAWLAAFYGGLLTARQREAIALHCEEDLSLGEIAQEMGISRQAVHETISRAAQKLFDMEDSLGAAARFRRMETGLTRCRDALRAGDQAGALSLLEEMLREEQQDSRAGAEG
ncbi:MAG: helix-turn-helix domain-containing protein [Clostridia bacterium]|nr:helix-turn-helix domain-containing protein [Clostridia bacterium]